MKIVTFDDIKNLNITPKQCYEWASDMIQDKENTLLPPKISMRPMEGVFCNVMPCIISNTILGKIGGVKVVNRYPDRIPSLSSKLLLLNIDNGEFLALMDANWITAMRTGAVAAHSVVHFAKKNFKTISVLGLGNTARATLLVLANIFPDRVFDIRVLKYKNQEKSFVERFKEYSNLHFTFVEDSPKLIKGADVVISCVTYFMNDFCADDFFDEGVLVVPVHTRGFANCDLFFDKIYADDYNHVCNFQNFSKFKKFAEVSDVIKGKAEGRKNDKERILAYNIGVAIHDINYAVHIYQMLENDVRLKEIEMYDPTEKFWI